MAIKIFCNACQQYIRDAKPGEINSLKGTEICASCETRINQLLSDIERAAQKAINGINTLKGGVLAEIDEAKRRVIQKET